MKTQKLCRGLAARPPIPIPSIPTLHRDVEGWGVRNKGKIIFTPAFCLNPLFSVVACYIPIATPPSHLASPAPFHKDQSFGLSSLFFTQFLFRLSLKSTLSCPFVCWRRYYQYIYNKDLLILLLFTGFPLIHGHDINCLLFATTATTRLLLHNLTGPLEFTNQKFWILHCTSFLCAHALAGSDVSTFCLEHSSLQS